MQVIKTLLLKIIDDIDAGNSKLSESECLELIENLRVLSNKDEKLSKYQAIKYLGISRATFDNYVREGKLPKGKKQQGFTPKF